MRDRERLDPRHLLSNAQHAARQEQQRLREDLLRRPGRYWAVLVELSEMREDTRDEVIQKLRRAKWVSHRMQADGSEDEREFLGWIVEPLAMRMDLPDDNAIEPLAPEA